MTTEARTSSSEKGAPASEQTPRRSLTAGDDVERASHSTRSRPRSLRVQRLFPNRSSHSAERSQLGHEEHGEKGTDEEQGFPDGGLDAWLTVLGAAVAMCVSFGAVTSFAVYQEYYSKTVLADQSQSAISWIGSLQLMLVFAMTVPSGYLLTWTGPKIPMILGTIFIVAGTVSASFAKTYIQFFLAQGLCCGIGEGLIMLPVVSMPTEWFFKKRSFVSGLVAAGSAAGGVILPIAINRLLNDYHVSLGWTHRIVALIQLCGMLIAILLVKSRFQKDKPSLPWKIYFASRAMNFLFVGSFLMYAAQYIPYLYITVYGVHCGADPALAFYFSAILNGGAVIGRLLVGSMADSYGTYNALITMAFFSGIVAFTQTKATSTAGIVVWSATYGFISGSLQSLFTPAIARLAPTASKIGGFVGIGCTLVSPALLASQPIAGALLGPDENNFLAQSIFTGVLCLAASGALAISRSLLPDRAGWKH